MKTPMISKPLHHKLLSHENFVHTRSLAKTFNSIVSFINIQDLLEEQDTLDSLASKAVNLKEEISQSAIKQEVTCL